MTRTPPAALCLAVALVVGSCDGSIGGESAANLPPETDLSVRDTSLVDNIAEVDRLPSTVLVSWTGTDPDGFVTAFEVRFHGPDIDGTGDGWIRTERRDTLILLPIPRGEKRADVVFEVRAIDNEQLADPSPAITVFPIRNAPPTIRLSAFELPPDTTFTVFSFGWVVGDPEGPDNLERIEFSFNDTLHWVSLPVETDFASFVVEDEGLGEAARARVYAGRAFQRTDVLAPGVRLDAVNSFFVRAVDQTDTTSTREEYRWFVKRQSSDVLIVNDFRKSGSDRVLAFHRSLLADLFPPGYPVDVWDITLPYVTGATGNTPRSDALPPAVAPTVRSMMAQWKYIYWVSTNTVNAITGNNLPYVAGGVDQFFDQGGKMMVMTPITQPQNVEDNLGNPAVLLLPLSDLLVRPDSLQRLELARGQGIHPVAALPGVSEDLPELVSANFFFNELPYYAGGANLVPLYEADFGYLTRTGRRGDWPGPSTIASMSADGRVGMFALPLVSEVNGGALVTAVGGDAGGARSAVQLILRSLGFPSR